MLFEETVWKKLHSVELYGCLVPDGSCSIEWLVESELRESNRVLRCSVETPVIRSLFGVVSKNRHDFQYVKSVHQIPSVKTDGGLSNAAGSIGNAVSCRMHKAPICMCVYRYIYLHSQTRYSLKIHCNIIQPDTCFSSGSHLPCILWVFYHLSNTVQHSISYSCPHLPPLDFCIHTK